MSRFSDARCCAPSRSTVESASPAGRPAQATPGAVPGRGASLPRLASTEMVSLPGATFVMGSADPLAYPEDGETPKEVQIGPFLIDPCTVSNADFAEFVLATEYVTEAERFGWSFVFGGLLPDDFPPTRAVAAAPWWRQVYGADWRHPAGPGSEITDVPKHPAVHVSYNDALSYCVWAGKRLASEAEWEFAAAGGLVGAVFPWGDELEPEGEHRMNVWQGSFPNHNTEADGYYGTCPVDAFAPNGYGLYNVTGNVWEWTADRFDPTVRTGGPRVDLRAPEPGAPRVQKGGSHLCHASYCRRYRVAARQGNEPDSTASNVSFRCAADADPGGAVNSR